MSIMKRCSKCKRKREIADFSKDRTTASGLCCYCSKCRKLRRRARRIKNNLAAKAWRAKNREKARRACRDYYWRNRTTRLKKMEKWRNGNRDKCHAAAKNWRKNNPIKTLALNHNYRVRKKTARGSFSDIDWEQLCEVYKHKCAYCHRKRKLTIHHLVPLSKCGSNTIKNVLPACQPCNSSIGAKVVFPAEYNLD